MSNGASPSARPTLHPIAAYLEGKQVRAVTIIDDAFDVNRTSAELISGEPGSFWERIEFNEEARGDLVSQGIHIEDEYGVSQDETLQKLWQLREEPTELGAAIREVLFPSVLEKMSFLQELVGRLRDHLGLTVYTYGKDIDVESSFGDKEVQLVFLDFILGSENNVDDSVRSSKNIARQIYKHHIGRRMPLVILMSNAGSVFARSEEFRKSSGLLKGIFYVVHKDDLASEEKVFLNVGVWSKALPLGADLQSFVNTLQTSIKSASIKFMNGIKELSLEDYRYIQRLSLLEDGQPLGDYLIGLYSAYLGHLLFERDAALHTQRKLVDELATHYPPPGSTMPSMQLIKMYHTALFELEGIGEAGFNLESEEEDDHTLYEEKQGAASLNTNSSIEGVAAEPTSYGDLREESEQLIELPERGEVLEGASVIEDGEQSLFRMYERLDENGLLGLYDQMYLNSGVTSIFAESYGKVRELRLGDLFISEGEMQALLIISADCDLASRPNAACEPTDSVHVLPGRLQLLRERIKDADEKKKRTELFTFSNQSYRIIWELKKVKTLTFAEIHTFLKKWNYAWKARLRQPYALELQRMFASDLTRIGMPVPPPLYQPIGVEFVGRVGNAGWESIMPMTEDLAVAVMKGGKTRCYPTIPFSHKLREAVGRLIKLAEERQERLRPEKGAKEEVGKLGMQIASLKKMNAGFEMWFCGLEELVLPAQAHKVVKVPNMTELGLGWNLAAADHTDNKSMLLTINITGLLETPASKKEEPGTLVE